MWTIPLHPIFAAIYPVLNLYSVNVDQVAFTETILAYAFTFGLTALAWGVTALILRDIRKAAVFATVCMLLFFLYGSIHWQISNRTPFSWLHRAADLTMLAGLTGVFVLLLRSRPGYYRATHVLNAVGIALLLLPAVTVITALTARASTHAETTVTLPDLARKELPGTSSLRTSVFPDVYILVLDGYPRPDVLESTYGVDISPFLEHLERQGFHIVPEARANYAATKESISSMLNLCYLQEEWGDQASELMEENRLFAYLKSKGYATVAYPNAMFTELPSSDIFPSSQHGFANRYSEFMVTLRSRTPLPKLKRRLEIPTPRYRLTESAFEHVVTVPNIAKPTVTFLHVWPPHGAPYVFSDSLAGEIRVLNEMVTAVVDTILMRSRRPPVIIIQSDHGHRELVFQHGEYTLDGLNDMFGIFLAVHLPNAPDTLLYSGMTPVNLYRQILNQYFDIQLPLLDDKSFLGYWSNESFTDITSAFDDDADWTEIPAILEEVLETPWEGH